MHLPFNAGYLDVVRHAFPDDEIIFSACEDHIDNLRADFPATADIEMAAVARHVAPPGKSLHLPWVGRRVARQSLAEAHRVLRGRPCKLVTVCGVNAGLLSVFPKAWEKSPGTTVHYIIHNQLGAAVRWRSHNPIVRAFDFTSVVKNRLPSGQALMVLELGLADTLARMFPAHQGRVVTLEHPVVAAEVADPVSPSADRPVRVAFTGHCGLGKGFDLFAALARDFAGPTFEFHAIGRANPNASRVDTSALKRCPTEGGVDRPDFVAALQSMDVVCLPLESRSQYVSSGSIIDAFAAGKPLLIIRNNMHTAIQEKYGEFGHIVDTPEDLRAFFVDFDPDDFRRRYAVWANAIQAICQARGADQLGKTYRESIEAASETPSDGAL